MSRAGSERGRPGKGPWPCPACGAEVRAQGASERQPVRCGGCGRLYRHPRMALLLALAVPGLGSVYQRRWAWGLGVMALGTAAFVATLARIGWHLYRVIVVGTAEPLRIIGESAVGTGIVILAYGLDLALVWWRRDRLVPR